jgi:hypothetical protein
MPALKTKVAKLTVVLRVDFLHCKMYNTGDSRPPSLHPIGAAAESEDDSDERERYG